MCSDEGGNGVQAAHLGMGQRSHTVAISGGLRKKIAGNGQYRFISGAVLIHVMAPVHGCLHTKSMDLIESLPLRYVPDIGAGNWVSGGGFQAAPPLRLASFAADPFSYFCTP